MSRAAPARRVLAACALLAAQAACHAACTLVLAPARLAFGPGLVGALPAADVAGWRVLGTAASTLTGSCAPWPGRLRIQLEALQPMQDGLLLWNNRAGPSGRVRLALQQASVGGRAVAFSFSGAPGAPGPGPLVLARDGVIELDLSTVRETGGPPSFTLGFSVTGLVPRDHRATSPADFWLSTRLLVLP